MITLALIGVGKWGQNYIKTINEIKKVQLKYICATSQQSLSQFPKSYIKINSYKNLLNHKDIDGIIIVTPASSHFEISKFFLFHKIPVLVEKPMVSNYKDALSLEKIYRRSSTLFMVGHTFIYNPAFLKTVELAKKIGKVKYIEFIDCNFGPIRSDVSALWDFAPHAVSMMLEVLKDHRFKISAWGVNSGLVYSRIDFTNGALVFLKIGSEASKKQRQMTVFGNKGYIVFDDTIDKKITLFYNSNLSYPTYSKVKPLKAEVLEFVDCIKQKRNPKTDFIHGFKTIKVISAMEGALKANKEVNVVL